METDRLKELWQRQEAAPKPPAPGDAGQVMARFAKWRRQVRHRDYRETAAALICIVVFGRLVFVLPSVVARATSVFLVACSVLTIVMLVRARPSREDTDRAITVREFCENEIRRIDVQIRLLRSVAYWCVIPILVGVNVLVASLSPRLLWTVAYLVVTLVFGAWLVWINLRAARTYLLPLRNELVRILGEES